MDTFASLKNNRQASINKLTEELTKVTTKQQRADDERFWKPTVDQSGNGNAIIRFLPSPKGEEVPFVRTWNHGFQGPTGLWYIEESLTTIGKPDPVSEFNSQLWNSGSEANKEIARKQKRRLQFISNIYVIKDPAHPENEGKVFLYKYGKKIFDKLNDLMNPSFEDDKPVNPYDLWEGANFRLRVRMVDRFRNYDKSEFDNPGPLFQNEAKMEEVWNREYPLQEFLTPDKFKDYKVLKRKLEQVLGLDKLAPEDVPPFDVEEAPIGKQIEVEDDEEVRAFKDLIAEDA